MMRISEKFKELREKDEGALIGFITVGDPRPEDTVDIANSLISGGIDILELGLPFSDPIADGPTIQRASERSLRNGINPDIYFEIVKKIDNKIPKVCLTYYNIVLKRGLEKFAQDCKDSGILGLIVPDLPIEEAEPLLRECKRNHIDLIFLVAPTTTEERLQKIFKKASGFLYVVSLLGVTGTRKEFSKTIKPTLEKIKKSDPKIPLAVGFGISKPEHVEKVMRAGAQGAIVGSAFIRIIEKNLDDRKKMQFKLKRFAYDLKKATVKINAQEYT